MHGQIARSKAYVVPFVRTAECSDRSALGQLDQAGQTILQLLRKAAGITEENSRHAVEAAQKLSHQLRAAEDRIAELEAEVTAYQEKADRAEQWLHRIYTEIEDRLLRQDDQRRSVQRVAGR